MCWFECIFGREFKKQYLPIFPSPSSWKKSTPSVPHSASSNVFGETFLVVGFEVFFCLDFRISRTPLSMSQFPALFSSNCVASRAFMQISTGKPRALNRVAASWCSPFTDDFLEPDLDLTHTHAHWYKWPLWTINMIAATYSLSWTSVELWFAEACRHSIHRFANSMPAGSCWNMKAALRHHSTCSLSWFCSAWAIESTSLLYICFASWMYIDICWHDDWHTHKGI